MSCFYEIVLRLPSDVETDLDGASDEFVNWITGKEWTLPPDSDLDLDQIEQPHLTLADKLWREFYVYWKGVSKTDSKYFVQLEKGRDLIHMHVVIETAGVKSFVLGRYLGQIRDSLVRTVYRGAAPKIESWLTATKTKSDKGTNRTCGTSYIVNYLLPKVQSELQWAWTNIEEYKLAALNLEERRRIVDEQRAAHAEQSGFGAVPADVPVLKTKASEKYRMLVNWLVENGITTEKQWIRENSDSYLSFNSTGNARASIKSALDNACKVMSLTKSAADYLVGKGDPGPIEENRIYRIFAMNGYDPAYAGSVLLGWCRQEFGKRNAVWLFGPATTGKTNIAEAIAHTVPFYGCVNWNNENFPFNDCVDKMLIWWEEGKMTAKVVEQAKAILGGSKVRVDIKCKTSQPMEPTPVIITSNTNMCCVVDGNSTTFEHEQPLQDRMFKFELTRRLEPTFGKVTKQEVKDFFRWAELNRQDVRHEFHVTKGGAKRSHAPEEEYKSPAKRAKVSFDAETASGADVPVNYSSRYVSKCSQHLGMSNMLYPCGICERMNRSNNVCTPHGKSDCSECFPSDFKDVNFTTRYVERCDAHSFGVNVPLMCIDCEYLNRNVACCFDHGRTKCEVCHAVPPWERENVDLDDCNKEQ